MIKELDNNDSSFIKQLEEAFPYFFLNNDYYVDIKQNVFSKYFIYIEKSNIIGFVNYYDLYDRFELSYIEVKSEFRNKKIGSYLIEHLIKIGTEKNIENITLEVNINNKNAIDLYKKYGFNEVAIRKGYYNGIDGILMERKMV